MTDKVFRFSIYFALLLALGSWIASLAGANVQNLISSEGLRWMLLHGFQDGAYRLLPSVVLGCVAVGSFPSRLVQRDILKLGFRYAIAVALWAFLAFWQGSPLRGISGGLFPSPLSHSWFVVVCLSVIAVNLTFNWKTAVSVLSNGLRKYGHIVILFLVFAFLYNEVVYIWK